MGYYWVTTAQHYIQHLGFGSTLPPVNQRRIELRIDQYGGDNSFFRDDKANITLGKGGVDDAEDAEVIVHEYGHSVQDGQVTGFGTTLESGAIGEGFGDYLSVAVTSWATGTPTKTPEACVADWDSTSYTSTTPHCLRRLDGTKHYPEDVVGEVHADGEIWSRALWDIRQHSATPRATTLIIDAQFAFTPDTSFRAAAQATVAATQRRRCPSSTMSSRRAVSPVLICCRACVASCSAAWGSRTTRGVSWSSPYGSAGTSASAVCSSASSPRCRIRRRIDSMVSLLN
jgi:zinc metalloprotease ZmpB